MPLTEKVVIEEHGKSSVYFDIKVTDETNTKAEKARYIREAFARFENLLGNLHDESYIYVQDVRAAAYGYGGKTMESSRLIQPVDLMGWTLGQALQRFAGTPDLAVD